MLAIQTPLQKKGMASSAFLLWIMPFVECFNMFFPFFCRHEVSAIRIRRATSPPAIWQYLYVAAGAEIMWCWSCSSVGSCAFLIVVFHFVTAMWANASFSFIWHNFHPRKNWNKRKEGSDLLLRLRFC